MAYRWFALLLITMSSVHHTRHQPILHEGIVIKSNANQRYATNAVTSALFKAVCHSAGTCADERDPTGKAERQRAPYHDFVVRNDMGCGSTIGPMAASNLGMRTIDIGIPQWAMHQRINRNAMLLKLSLLFVFVWLDLLLKKKTPYVYSAITLHGHETGRETLTHTHIFLNYFSISGHAQLHGDVQQHRPADAAGLLRGRVSQLQEDRQPQQSAVSAVSVGAVSVCVGVRTIKLNEVRVTNLDGVRNR